MFNTTAATTYVVNSPTQITATVPIGATTGPLHVTTSGGGPANSATNFTVVAGPSSRRSRRRAVRWDERHDHRHEPHGCDRRQVQRSHGDVHDEHRDVGDRDRPAGATTGKITVTTPGGTATSATKFKVEGAVTKHKRTVTLALKKHLVASGTVKVKDGFNACRSNVTVKIQRLKNGAWTGVGSDKTAGNGNYKVNLKDKTGKYRAIAKKKTLNGGDDICVADTSKTVKHTH